jgi:hypothetical protein
MVKSAPPVHPTATVPHHPHNGTSGRPVGRSFYMSEAKERRLRRWGAVEAPGPPTDERHSRRWRLYITRPPHSGFRQSSTVRGRPIGRPFRIGGYEKGARGSRAPGPPANERGSATRDENARLSRPFRHHPHRRSACRRPPGRTGIDVACLRYGAKGVTTSHDIQRRRRQCCPLRYE